MCCTLPPSRTDEHINQKYAVHSLRLEKKKVNTLINNLLFTVSAGTAEVNTLINNMLFNVSSWRTELNTLINNILFYVSS